MNRVRRYAPTLTFPPYTYISGRAPHPIRDPAGHAFGKEPEEVAPLNAADWHCSVVYQQGIDLFNAGYYWEAHEVWESLWKVALRGSCEQTLLLLLIKLAAAGVKAREGRAVGIARHAVRARELLDLLPSEREPFAGLSRAGIEQVIAAYETLATQSVAKLAQFPATTEPVCVVEPALVLME